MRRREFVTLVASAAVCPFGALAQQSGPPRKVGMLLNSAEDDPEWKAWVAIFLQRLRSLGWVEGQNLRIDTRYAVGDLDHARVAATELIRLAPDVILSSSTANLTALLRQAPTMPIVFVQVSDPVAQGFVSNLAHPEGNITGISAYEFSIGGKWADLLKQMAPGLAHISLIFNPDTAPQSRFFLRSVEAVAPVLGIDVTAVPVHDAPELQHAMESVSRQSNSGMIFTTDSFHRLHTNLVAETAARVRVPAIFNDRIFVEAGGLMSYGIEYEAVFRQAAAYVDRILKGAQPRDLPIQGPSKFSLVINVKTAKALDIDVPMSLLLNADDYIE
jgi:putative tryptophan/tyrosine transport system substrate-binding protein